MLLFNCSQKTALVKSAGAGGKNMNNKNICDDIKIDQIFHSVFTNWGT